MTASRFRADMTTDGDFKNEGYSSEDEPSRGRAAPSGLVQSLAEVKDHETLPSPAPEVNPKTEPLSPEVEQPPSKSYWIDPLLSFFGDVIANFGGMCAARPLRVASACTGLWSEGAALKVRLHMCCGDTHLCLRHRLNFSFLFV